MSGLLYPYPTDFMEPCQVLLSKVRGESVPLAEVAHASWQIAGYGMNQFLPDRGSGGGGGSSAKTATRLDLPTCTEAEAKKCLESVCEPDSGDSDDPQAPKRGPLLDLMAIKKILSFALSILSNLPSLT